MSAYSGLGLATSRRASVRITTSSHHRRLPPTPARRATSSPAIKLAQLRMCPSHVSCAQSGCSEAVLAPAQASGRHVYVGRRTATKCTSPDPLDLDVATGARSHLVSGDVTPGFRVSVKRSGSQRPRCCCVDTLLVSVAWAQPAQRQILARNRPATARFVRARRVQRLLPLEQGNQAPSTNLLLLLAWYGADAASEQRELRARDRRVCRLGLGASARAAPGIQASDRPTTL